MFDITIDGRKEEASEFINLIDYYYGTEKDAKYIEIGDELYYLENINGDINPLGIKSAKPFSSLKTNSDIRAVVYVTTLNDDIHLTLKVFISKPRNVITSKGFEYIKLDRECPFIKHQLEKNSGD